MKTLKIITALSFFLTFLLGVLIICNLIWGGKIGIIAIKIFCTTLLIWIVSGSILTLLLSFEKSKLEEEIKRKTIIKK